MSSPSGIIHTLSSAKILDETQLLDLPSLGVKDILIVSAGRRVVCTQGRRSDVSLPLVTKHYSQG